MKLNSIYENSLDNKRILDNLKFKVKDGGFINYDPNKGSYLTLTNKEQLEIDAKDSFNNEISFLLDIYIKYDKKINDSKGTLLQLNLASCEETFKVISKTVNKKVQIYFGTENLNREVQDFSVVENRWINLTIIKVGEILTLFVNGVKNKVGIQLTDYQLCVDKICPFKIILGGSEDNEDVFNYADLSLFAINELKEYSTPAEILDVFKSYGKDYVKDISNRALLNKQYSYQLYNVDNGGKHLEQGAGEVKLDLSSLKQLIENAKNVSIKLSVKKGVFKVRDISSSNTVDTSSFESLAEKTHTENTHTENQLIFENLNKNKIGTFQIPLSVWELDNLSQQDRVFSELEVLLDGNEEDKIVLFNTTDLIDNRGIETSPFELLLLNSNELHNHDESDTQSLTFRLINKSDVDIINISDAKFNIISLSKDVIDWSKSKAKLVHLYSKIDLSYCHSFEKEYLEEIIEDLGDSKGSNNYNIIPNAEINILNTKVESTTNTQNKSKSNKAVDLNFQITLKDLKLSPGNYLDIRINNIKVNEVSAINPSAEYSFCLEYLNLSGFRDGALPFKIKTVNVLDNLPIGTILPYTGAKVPKGWLVCDGEADISKYRKLKEILGTQKVPNLINRFLFGSKSNELNIRPNDDKIHIEYDHYDNVYEKEEFDKDKNPLLNEKGYGGKDRVRLHHKNLPDHDHSYYYNEFLDQYGDIDERMSINELLLDVSCPEPNCTGSLSLSNQCSNIDCKHHTQPLETKENVENSPLRFNKYFPINQVTKAQMNKVVRTTGNTIYSEHHRSHADTDKLLNKSFNIIPPYFRVVYIIKAR